MNPSSTTTSPRPGCGGCRQAGHCSANPPEDALPLEGWRLALGSLALFVGPVLFAVAGAVFCREHPFAQLAGAVGGFAVGAVCWGVLVARLAGREAS